MPWSQSSGQAVAFSGRGDRARFIGATPHILKLKGYIARAAAIDCNVLITGETGTGKEKVAELIHWHSSRRRQPMVCINCAALPENLLEGELFGFERGAFTGALAAYPGKLGLAEGGTVFLDEIFEMSPYMQAKILRVVDTRKIYRLGGKNPSPSTSGSWRPPTRTRKPPWRKGLSAKTCFTVSMSPGSICRPCGSAQLDIPLLLRHFLREMNRRYGRRVENVSPEVMALLLGYGWPGNIRELRSLVEALFINLAFESRCVSLSELPETFSDSEKAWKPPRRKGCRC